VRSGTLESNPLIRAAEHDDVPALVELLAPFFEASGMAQVAAWCPDSLSASLHQMIDLPSAILLAAWNGPVIVGTVGAMLFPAYFNRAVTIGQETFFWILPGQRGALGPAMLSAIESAAKEKGATRFLMVSLEALRPDAVGKMYQRRGYAPLEHSYVRAL